MTKDVYKLTGATHPEDTAEGVILAPGDTTEGIKFDPSEPHNKRLIADNVLTLVEEPKKAKQSRKGEEAS